MNSGRVLAVAAVFLIATLIAQPVLSADNLTEFITGANVTSVTNQTSDLEQDQATRFFNYAQRQLAGCGNSCDYASIISMYDQALAENTSMLRKTDGLQYLYQGKSYAQIQMELYSDADATADAGLAEYPGDAMLWNNKGWALQNLGRNTEALAAYDKAVSFDQNYTTALVNQGDLLNEMGKYTEAIDVYTRANETDPFNIAASEGLEAAQKGEAESSRTTGIVMVIVLIAVIGFVVWYVKIRKPGMPAPDGKKKKSKKK